MKNTRTDFVHPELLSHEIFFTNATSEQFKKIMILSKRKGLIAYDGVGNKLNHPDWFPIFVSTEELTRMKISIADLRKSSI